MPLHDSYDTAFQMLYLSMSFAFLHSLVVPEDSIKYRRCRLSHLQRRKILSEQKRGSLTKGESECEAALKQAHGHMAR